jgi:hypothetical protein
MRNMARALGLLLVVAFAAGLWDARYGQEERRPAPSAPFRTATVERERSPRTAPELVAVEAVDRDGYDRVVFTFDGSRPGYRVRYVDQVTDQAGKRLPVPGEAFLEVAFEPARARSAAGEPTFSPASLTPGFADLRQVRFAGDFEGEVTFGIGAAGRGGFRVSELRDPIRVAIDVRS